MIIINKHLPPLAQILLIYLCSVSGLVAQELEPRSYANAPDGLNFVVAGYQNSQGGLVLDPAIPISDATSRVNVAILGYLRMLNVAGLSSAINHWIVEATANVTFYSENDTLATDKVRKQVPVYSVQGNLTYTFKNKIWLSYGVTYFIGGETKVEGVVSNDLQA